VDLQTIALLEHSRQLVVLLGNVRWWTGLEKEVIVSVIVEHYHSIGVAAILQETAIQTAQLMMRGYVQLFLMLLLELFILVILFTFFFMLLSLIAYV
jgi:hypothetical protein